MHIVCLMPTYNRAGEQPQLLAEAIGAFVHQTWRQSTLLIGNDTPGQQIHCAHPRVEVINYPGRFETLGHKIADMARQAVALGAEALCRWDDDDYSLPHRLEMSAYALDDRLEWRPSNYWWFQNGRPGEVWEVQRAGNTHCMALWRPELLERIGGYPLTSGDEDQRFSQAVARAGITPLAGAGNLPPDDIFYVYRWGVSNRHLSGRGGGERLREQYLEIGRRPIRTGDFEIAPQVWQLPGKRVLLQDRPQQGRADGGSD